MLAVGTGSSGGGTVLRWVKRGAGTVDAYWGGFYDE
jgi:hypothetical protein